MHGDAVQRRLRAVVAERPRLGCAASCVKGAVLATCKHCRCPATSSPVSAKCAQSAACTPALMAASPSVNAAAPVCCVVPRVRRCPKRSANRALMRACGNN